MRMDPDGLYVGEIRDRVTSEVLEHSILTGHSVLGTLHSMSPLGAIWRLEELGLTRAGLMREGFIVAVAHQHLLPVLCPHCRKRLVEAKIDKPILQALIRDLGDDVVGQAYSRGEGCGEGTCFGGVIRRQAVASILMPDAEFRRLLLAGKEVEAMRRWRNGEMSRHGEVQAANCIIQAHKLIADGLVCPIDADRYLGRLSVEVS